MRSPGKMDDADFFWNNTYNYSKLTCADLKLFFDKINDNYEFFIINFRIGATLGDSRLFYLMQTTFALIVFVINNIRNQNSGEIMESIIEDEEIYWYSE
jgi:hypothetical protein